MCIELENSIPNHALNYATDLCAFLSYNRKGKRYVLSANRKSLFDCRENERESERDVWFLERIRREHRIAEII